jgi:cyclic 2,3-diphosphoglycerate synthetase
LYQGIDWISENKFVQGKRILCLVDGEHYPPVTRWALEELGNIGAEIVGLVFLGGTEKVQNAFDELKDYKVFAGANDFDEVLNLISSAVKETSPEVVIDLSDDPVIDYWDRFKIGSCLLREGITYIGSDFQFVPPSFFEILEHPSLGIIGTGKRVGKTAISVDVARILKKNGCRLVIVAMGRGGPSNPDLIFPHKNKMSADFLIKVAEKGGHAASDYWEDAMLAGVTTIGCRRCGGGMVGSPFVSNVIEGAKKTNSLDVDFVIMEGSGPTLPPVKTEKNLVVVGAGQPLENILKFFGEYRLLISDMAIVTLCEEPIANKEKLVIIEQGIKKVNPEIDIALTVFRPKPLGDIKGKKVFVATTSPAEAQTGIIGHLESGYDCEVSGFSRNLSDRKKLKEDLEEGLDCAEVLLTEIKAASIDVAARMAKKKGKEIVFLHNHAVLVGGTIDSIEKSILSLCGLNPKQGGIS